MKSKKAVVNICCAIRQESQYIAAFLSQIKSIISSTFDVGVIVIAVDGQEIRDPILACAQADMPIVTVFEGAFEAAGFDIVKRAVQWARTGNLAIDKSLEHKSDFTLWIESDLSFPCDLIDLLIEPDVDIVAPVVMLGDKFYDSWGFRDLGGARITSLKMLQDLALPGQNLVELSSVGSCLLIRSEILVDGVRMKPDYADGLLVGLCQSARSRGARIFCRLDSLIVHPTTFWKAQIYKIVSFRLGSNQHWHEVLENDSNGLVVAGPFFEFILPLVEKIVLKVMPRPGRLEIRAGKNNHRQLAVAVGYPGNIPPLALEFTHGSESQVFGNQELYKNA